MRLSGGLSASPHGEASDPVPPKVSYLYHPFVCFPCDSITTRSFALLKAKAPGYSIGRRWKNLDLRGDKEHSVIMHGMLGDQHGLNRDIMAITLFEFLIFVPPLCLLPL
jgi:hypothetical protein